MRTVVVLLNDWRAIPREGKLRKTVRASILTVIGTLRTIGQEEGTIATDGGEGRGGGLD